MLECPNCRKETNKLIGSDELNKVVCPACHPGQRDISKMAKYWELGWKESDGVTKGKAWEIDNRVISKDDSHTIVNKITGRPAQR